MQIVNISNLIIFLGIMKDRQDKSAVDWSYHEKVDKHESQKGITFGIRSKAIKYHSSSDENTSLNFLFSQLPAY